jgi:hypothetical protein
MLESITLVYHQMVEALAEGGVRKVLLTRVFWNRLATPAVMELSTSNLPPTAHLQDANFQFIELKINDLQAGKYSFAIPSRGLKALRNLKRGWRGFAVIENAIVVGDMWCITPNKDEKRIFHPDLKMLGVTSEEGDAYAFDMFITPDYRGKNLAVPLQKSLHATLKMEGCPRVYGFFWNDNLPALWMHRMIKYQELPKRCISRFFIFVRSRATGSTT